jgi:hypothetical protein
MKWAHAAGAAVMDGGRTVVTDAHGLPDLTASDRVGCVEVGVVDQ